MYGIPLPDVEKFTSGKNHTGMVLAVRLDNQTQGLSTQSDKSLMRLRFKAHTAIRERAVKPGVRLDTLIVVVMRPLNSWMAFRTYYAPIFSTYQQKDISGYLRRMWHADFSQAKWAIVAEAYSIIRDRVGKAQAPLDAFLQIVCPHIGIISPAEYLSTQGWLMPERQEKEMIRLFVPDVSIFDSHMRMTNPSADDLVKFCRETGYFVGDFESTAASRKAVLTMATEPNVSGADFQLAVANQFAIEHREAPAAIYEANNLLLAMSGDSYPFNGQSKPDNLTTDCRLYFDPNGGDQFNAFDVNDTFSHDGIFGDHFWRQAL